jgi:hypothetical protein
MELKHKYEKNTRLFFNVYDLDPPPPPPSAIAGIGECAIQREKRLRNRQGGEQLSHGSDDGLRGRWGQIRRQQK